MGSLEQGPMPTIVLLASRTARGRPPLSMVSCTSARGRSSSSIRTRWRAGSPRFRHPPASRVFAAQTGGPSGAREREPAAHTTASDILPEQIAFGAAGSPGLRCASPEDDERKRPARSGTAMNKSIFDHETILKAGKRAAEMAKHGTREEKSGKFLPPPGWKGHLVTAADAAPPRRRRKG